MASCGHAGLHFAPNQLMWSQVQISPQHLPILVAGDQRHFGYVEARLEQAARRFMAQVVEVQVFDAKFAACPTESRPE